MQRNSSLLNVNKQCFKQKQQTGGGWTSYSKGATRFGGWKFDGVKRFNELWAHCKRSRK